MSHRGSCSQARLQPRSLRSFQAIFRHTKGKGGFRFAPFLKRLRSLRNGGTFCPAGALPALQRAVQSTPGELDFSPPWTGAMTASAIAQRCMSEASPQAERSCSSKSVSRSKSDCSVRGSTKIRIWVSTSLHRSQSLIHLQALGGDLEKCLPWHLSRREAKTRFTLHSIFQALGRLKNGGASCPARAPRIFRGALVPSRNLGDPSRSARLALVAAPLRQIGSRKMSRPKGLGTLARRGVGRWARQGPGDMRAALGAVSSPALCPPGTGARPARSSRCSSAG